jgi:hypothetical protein
MGFGDRSPETNGGETKMRTSMLFAVIAVVAVLGIAGLAIASSTGAGIYSSQTRSGGGSGMMGGGSGMMGGGSGMMGSGSDHMGSGYHDSCPMDYDHNRTYDCDHDNCPHMD